MVVNGLCRGVSVPSTGFCLLQTGHFGPSNNTGLDRFLWHIGGVAEQHRRRGTTAMLFSLHHCHELISLSGVRVTSFPPFFNWVCPKKNVASLFRRPKAWSKFSHAPTRPPTTFAPLCKASPPVPARPRQGAMALASRSSRRRATEQSFSWVRPTLRTFFLSGPCVRAPSNLFGLCL